MNKQIQKKLHKMSLKTQNQTTKIGGDPVVAAPLTFYSISCNIIDLMKKRIRFFYYNVKETKNKEETVHRSI
jgi:hypothetical protein